MSRICSFFLVCISYLCAEEIVVHVNKEQDKDKEKFTDKSTGTEMEQAVEPQSLLEWFAEKYKDFGANLEVFIQFANWESAFKHYNSLSRINLKREVGTSA